MKNFSRLAPARKLAYKHRLLYKIKKAVFRAAACRRGSQIAEASLVYPVIIVVSVMSVTAMVHFYSCSANAAAMSIDARSIADETAGSVGRTGDIYNAVNGHNSDLADENDNYYSAVYGKAYDENSNIKKNYSIEEESGLLYGKVTASYMAQLSMSGMFSASRSDVYSIRRSAINEAGLTWKKQLVGDIFGSISDADAPRSSAGSEKTSN